ANTSRDARNALRTTNRTAGRTRRFSVGEDAVLRAKEGNSELRTPNSELRTMNYERRSMNTRHVAAPFRTSPFPFIVPFTVRSSEFIVRSFTLPSSASQFIVRR